MARQFVQPGSSMDFSALPVTSGPLTISCWFNRDAIVFSSLTETLVGFSTVAAPQQAYILEITSSLNVQARQVGGVGPTTSTATSPGTAANGSWNFAAATFVTTGSRRVNLNGVSTSDGSVTFFGTATFGEVGALNGGLEFNGAVSNVAVWDVALTVDQVNQMAAGFSPFQVAAENLLAFFPMNRGGLNRSRVSSFILSPSGTANLVGDGALFPTYT